MSHTDALFPPKEHPYEGRLKQLPMGGHQGAVSRAVLLCLIMLIAPLSGCFGEAENNNVVNINAVLTIDGEPAEDATLRSGEWHDILLVGEGLRLSAPAHDVLLFVDGYIDIDSSVPVDGDRVLVQMLTTPYTESVELVVWSADGTKTVYNQSLVNGTPVVSGDCLLYTSPSPRDATTSRMPSSA